VEVEYGYARQWLDDGNYTGAISSTVHFGVTQRMDVRWNSDNLLVSGSSNRRLAGVGDSTFGARYRFNEQRRYVPSFGFLYGIKFPFSDPRKEQGSGYIDHSFALLASKDVGKTRFDFNAVRLALGSAGKMRSGTMAALALSRPIRGRLSATVEGYGGREEQQDGAASLLAAVSWRWSDRFLSDVGVERGLAGGVKRTKLTFGFSYAVGNLYRLDEK
jgi:hypothetical protein